MGLAGRNGAGPLGAKGVKGAKGEEDYALCDGRVSLGDHYSGRRFGSALKNPDFQKLAAAYTIPSLRVDNPGDFERTLKQAVQSERLNLVELAMDIMDP